MLLSELDGSVQVPLEYVKDGEIVLNISYDATRALQLGNDYIEFKARFGGQPRHRRASRSGGGYLCSGEWPGHGLFQ